MYKIEKKNNNKSFKNLKNDIIATILSATLSFSIFPTFFNKIKEDKIPTSHILNSILANIENAKYNIKHNDYPIEGVQVDNNTRYKYLSNKSLKEVCIFLVADNTDFLNYLNPNIEELTIYCYNNNSCYFNEENFKKLLDFKNLKRLNLLNFAIDNDFMSKLEIDTLKTNNPLHTKFTWIKNSKIKNIILDNKLYDAAVYMTNDILDYIENNNINLILQEGSIEDLRKINNELDDIITNYNLNSKNPNKKQKEYNDFQNIVLYIINSLEYDKELSEMQRYNVNKKIRGKRTSEIYEKGALYNALYKQYNSICGNYSALFQALAIRCNIESFKLSSNSHSWNLIYLNNNFYFVDTTWLDNEESRREIEINNKDVNWYLTVPNIYKNIDSSTSHDTILFPKEICEIVNNSDYGKDFRDNHKKLDLLGKLLIFISCCKVISCIMEEKEKEKENNKSK